MQSFLVYVRVEADVKSGDHPYLTENRVKKQLQKLLGSRSITEGLPCHGPNTITVSEVIETTKDNK